MDQLFKRQEILRMIFWLQLETQNGKGEAPDCFVKQFIGAFHKWKSPSSKLRFRLAIRD